MPFGFLVPGPMELVLVGIVAVLLFGSRLPKIAYSVGNSFTQFKKGLHESMEEIKECEHLLDEESENIRKSLK